MVEAMGKHVMGGTMLWKHWARHVTCAAAAIIAAVAAARLRLQLFTSSHCLPLQLFEWARAASFAADVAERQHLAAEGLKRTQGGLRRFRPQAICLMRVHFFHATVLVAVLLWLAHTWLPHTTSISVSTLLST